MEAAGGLVSSVDDISHVRGEDEGGAVSVEGGSEGREECQMIILMTAAQEKKGEV